MVGLFDTFGEAQRAVEDLLRYGMRREDISLLARDEHGDTSREHAIGATGAAEGVGAGAVGGSLAGGALGLLIGTGLLVIPGIGPVLAAGPLAAAIGSATAAVGVTALGAGIGAAAGGLMGSLIGAGISEEDAQTYVEGVRRGGTLVSVGIADHERDDVRQILVRNSVVDIESRAAEWRSAGWEAAGSRAIGDDTSIPRGERVKGPEGFEMGDDQLFDSNPAQFSAFATRGGPAVRVEGRPAGGAPVGQLSTDRGARIYDKEDSRAQLDTALAGHPEAMPVHGDFAHDQRQEPAPVEPDSACGQRGYEAHDADFMAHYEALTGSGGQPYDYYRLGYQFGYEMANDAGYRHESWAMAEGDARQRWEREARGSWEGFKQAIRYGWEKARGRA